jgi:hypothetical protein
MRNRTYACNRTYIREFALRVRQLASVLMSHAIMKIALWLILKNLYFSQ